MKTMYVGPTIIGVAARNTTYDDVPDVIKAETQAPFLAGLCVPLDKLPVALAQIRAKSGAFYTLYTKALRYGAQKK